MNLWLSPNEKLDEKIMREGERTEVAKAGNNSNVYQQMNDKMWEILTKECHLATKKEHSINIHTTNEFQKCY